MITMGSWAMLAWYFADEKIPAAKYILAKPEVFLLSPTFHIALMVAGEYSAQFDYCANTHYDCNGIGRLHRRHAPVQLCLSMPCAKEPNYRLPEPNKSSLAIRPAVAESVNWNILHEAKTADFALTQWKVGDLDLECKLSADGMEMALCGEGKVEMELPAFQFDGVDFTCISQDENSLSIAYRNWICRYRSNGRITNTGEVAHNRNGRYAIYRASSEKKLKLWISITPN
jgi:hypothetical protein